jgi:signal transduction histidine kinase
VDDGGLPPLFSRSLSRGQLVALDGAAAAGYTAFLLATSGAALLARPHPGVPLWAPGLAAAGIGLPLAVRRLLPRIVFGVVLAVSLLSTILGLVGDSFVGAAFALYVVALTLPRRRREPTLAIGLLSAFMALGAAAVGARGVSPTAAIPVDCAVLGGAWTVGRVVRERRAHTAEATAQLTGRAVTEERLRIARELHDVVAHSMSLIAVKAGVANHVAAARPEEALDALRVIEATSRSALAEMRSLLGVLRSGGEEGSAEASLAPAPGVDGLRGLADRAGMAGVRVRMEVRGLDRVPAGVGLSVYRIVQEALTNVVKHAAPTRCRVVVEADGWMVAIDVTDEGPGRRVLPDGGAHPGHGLLGMRERVTMYGGALRAGPRPDGGFAVSVSLPYTAVGEAT